MTAAGRSPQIAVCGGAAEPGEATLAVAEEVGRLLAEAGVTVVCGGGSGVMEAAARGAAQAGGDVVGVLRGEDPAEANEHCTHVVATGTGHARNLAVVASADAVIAIAGAWGTLSEIAFARRAGRPVVTLGSWELKGAGAMEQAPGIEAADDAEAAVAEALRHVALPPRQRVPITAEWHIAQVNIALPHEPLESPLLADFVAMLEPINALAESSPGFLWRLQDDGGDATGIRAFGDDRLIINMSLWESIEALWAFVYDSAHLDVMRRRRDWFARIAESHQALQWLPAGELPAVSDAELRVAALRERGPTPHAFTFKHRFGPPDAVDGQQPSADEREPCPAS